MLRTSGFLSAWAILALLAASAEAMETDNLTGRHDQLAMLPDSTAELDKVVNLRIMMAIQATNPNRATSCNQKELIRNLRYELDRNPIGEIERFAEFDPNVKRYLPVFSNSIYGKLTADVPNLTLSEKVFAWVGTIASSVRVNDQLIGTDKLGHFFSQGYEYFFQKDWHQALVYGMKLENEIYGKGVTGVYSYGDLNANFNGYLFWKNILGGKSPYVACVNGRFVQKNLFTWKSYVHAGWDEGINCSEYVSPEFTASVKKQQTAHGVKCPADPAACVKLVRHPCAAYLVSDECFKSAGVPRVENRQGCEAFIYGISEAPSCRAPLENWSSFVDTVDEMWGSLTFPVHSIEQKLNFVDEGSTQ